MSGTCSVTTTYPGDAQNLPSTGTASLVVALPALLVSSPMLGSIVLVALGFIVLALT